jgi:hypothetical protein
MSDQGVSRCDSGLQRGSPRKEKCREAQNHRGDRGCSAESRGGCSSGLRCSGLRARQQFQGTARRRGEVSSSGPDGERAWLQVGAGALKHCVASGMHLGATLLLEAISGRNRRLNTLGGRAQHPSGCGVPSHIGPLNVAIRTSAIEQPLFLYCLCRCRIFFPRHVLLVGLAVANFRFGVLRFASTGLAEVIWPLTRGNVIDHVTVPRVRVSPWPGVLRNGALGCAQRISIYRHFEDRCHVPKRPQA